MLKNKEKLDGIVLDIEFLLISVVQGAALVTLADNSSNIMAKMQFEFWLYVLSGLLIILIFWSQSIIHALSFIDWPMDLSHSFLYFLMSLIEVMAFHQLTDPLKWFAFMIALFVVAGSLYVLDLNLINKHREHFSLTKPRKLLFEHIFKRQTLELKSFIPMGIGFNLLAFLAILFSPQIFLDSGYHVIFIALQVIFGFYILINSINSFKQRTKLISESF